MSESEQLYQHDPNVFRLAKEDTRHSLQLWVRQAREHRHNTGIAGLTESETLMFAEDLVAHETASLKGELERVTRELDQAVKILGKLADNDFLLSKSQAREFLQRMAENKHKQGDKQ